MVCVAAVMVASTVDSGDRGPSQWPPPCRGTPQNGNTIDVQVLRPAGAEGVLPGVLHLRGGGFVYGELDGPSPMAREACVAACTPRWPAAPPRTGWPPCAPP
ncbi:hypothetical protein GCM10010341_74310 [Streptomyces noursei]|nr:hypothetical protein GCM10010341_74310 [Streptomyces noursei]